LAILVLLLFTFSAQSNQPVIDIQGTNTAQEKNIRAFLSLTQETCQSPDWRVNSRFNQSDQEIIQALHALGYYQVKIAKQLTNTEDCWQARFKLSIGQPVIIKALQVQIVGEAKQNPAFQHFLTHLPIKLGDILQHQQYEKLKQSLRSLALEYGYLDYHFSNKTLQVFPQQQRAAITLILDSGVRYHFGSITINQTVLDPNFIQRYLDIKQADDYDSQKLATTYNALNNSGYFSAVTVTPKFNQTTQHLVPIDILLTAKKRHDYSVGVGFGTDIGPLASFGYQNRRLNRQGDYLSLNLDISPILSSIESYYKMPFMQSRYDYISIGIGYKYERPKTFQSQKAKLSVQYQHSYPGGWRQVLFLDLTDERSHIGDTAQNSKLWVIGGRWHYKQANRVVRPTQGYRTELSLSTSPESWLSDVAFIQLSGQVKLIQSLPWSARLITRANLGVTWANHFNRLPASYRFFAGGIETIRGYAYKKLGSKDAQGKVIGGTLLSVASLEYEQFINADWGIASFIDAGNAYQPNEISIKIGAGLGLRWNSPIGPVRVDFAVPLSGASSAFQIHFAAGSPL